MLSNKQKREKCVIHLMRRSGKTFKKYIPGLPKNLATFILDYVQMDFEMSRNHSLWPVILTPYNLPSDMCMNTEYLFLTIL
ncbi:hypothetical protein ACCT31_38265, partial [Rhizobium ruizarguesonis]